LFLFYNAPLLEVLNQLSPQLSAIGFADDINLLTYSKSTAENCAALESAHEQCLEWASTHGMRFALQKYKLTHFTQKNGFNLKAPVQVQGRTIAPSPVVQILGLQLDTRLRWRTHIKAVNKKMETQMYALSCTTASTWGATIGMAQHIYLAVVRLALLYRATL
jgi:hypothetical protein